MRVVCAAGSEAKTDVLEKIAPRKNILILDTCDRARLSSFFQFVSTSIKATSRKVETNEIFSLDDLPPPPKNISRLYP
ncbi:MAG: hypothetical protein LBF41_02485, partial [Deltaproteobacteria bacterium]|nr:hypothetical protein [Deltaproteobacteria bacterium]